MSELLKQFENEDPEKAPVVEITDTNGHKGKYEFLDIVFFKSGEYAVLSDIKGDGYVDIFRIDTTGGKEKYEPVEDEAIAQEVFRLFTIKNEDEYDFF